MTHERRGLRIVNFPLWGESLGLRLLFGAQTHDSRQNSRTITSVTFEPLPFRLTLERTNGTVGGRLSPA
jgi:hypothetical protein